MEPARLSGPDIIEDVVVIVNGVSIEALIRIPPLCAGMTFQHQRHNTLHFWKDFHRRSGPAGIAAVRGEMVYADHVGVQFPDLVVTKVVMVD